MWTAELQQNEFLMQFQADILGIPVDAGNLRRQLHWGVAYMAAYGSGLFKDLDEIEANWKLKNVIIRK